MAKLLTSLFAAMFMLVSQGAWAGMSTPEQAQDLLAKAVAKVEAAGAEAAFAAFNDQGGDFVIDDLYVFAFDMQGTYMASGANPKLTGSNAIGLEDAEGKALVREMIALAKDSGGGKVDYVWLNRADNNVEQKHSFIKRVGDYIIGVGYYEP